jgi:hypothetical protein
LATDLNVLGDPVCNSDNSFELSVNRHFHSSRPPAIAAGDFHKWELGVQRQATLFVPQCSLAHRDL